jgi:hypothetical protein
VNNSYAFVVKRYTMFSVLQVSVMHSTLIYYPGFTFGGGIGEAGGYSSDLFTAAVIKIVGFCDHRADSCSISVFNGHCVSPEKDRSTLSISWPLLD